MGTYGTAALVNTTWGTVISSFNFVPGTNSNAFVDSGRWIVVSPGDALAVESVSVNGTSLYVSATQLTPPA